MTIYHSNYEFEEVVKPFGEVLRRYTDGSVVAKVNNYKVAIENRGKFIMLTHETIGFDPDVVIFNTIDELKSYLKGLGKR